MGGRPAIPDGSTIPDDHLIDPRQGRTGFRYLGLGYPIAPPLDWDDQHNRAEEQTYRWEPGRDWQPVADLYTDHHGVSPLNGWLVDA